MNQLLNGILATVLMVSAAMAQDYDVVILNGRVMDPETNFDAMANVGISSGWIVKITEEAITGKEMIDATGHVIAPGFIDLEQHGLGPWAVKVNLRDGVTTQMDFEVGALNISEWYAARAGKTQANYGTVIGQEFARMRIHDGLELAGPNVSMPYFFDYRVQAAEDGVDGWSVTRSDVDQMNAITKILDEGLRQGAIGVGSTIGYAREGITTYEMFEAQRAAARYGRVTSVHHRFHPSSATPTETQTGVNEILINAMVLKAPLHIHHDNDYGWWENQEKLAMARELGFNVWASYYPWDAGSETLVPPFSDRRTGKARWIINTKKRFTTREMTSFYPGRVSGTARKDPGYTLIAFSPPRKNWMPEWIKLPHFTVSGDGMPGLDAEGNRLDWDAPYEAYSGHPRAAGTHAKVLRLGRELGVPLQHTLAAELLAC
ncbi:MAG: aminoacylase [Gammaproteobacteria bacterium]